MKTQTYRRLKLSGLGVNKGFTLMEMILAICVLCILIAIVWPSYSGYKEKVRINQAKTDIRIISGTIESYQIDHEHPPDSLADIGNEGFLDPWGNPYQYYNFVKNGKGGARKDKNLNPLNTDFDLYSMGKDGQSKNPLTPKVSHDDIIRANNGRYIGLAADY